MWTRSVDRSALDHSRFREHSSIVREPSLVPTTAQCPLHFLHDRRKKRGSTGRGIKYDSPLVNKVPADPISRENFTPFMIQPEQGRKKLFLLGKPLEGLDRLSAVGFQKSIRWVCGGETVFCVSSGPRLIYSTTELIQQKLRKARDKSVQSINRLG